jgi:hypothetical protein
VILEVFSEGYRPWAMIPEMGDWYRAREEKELKDSNGFSRGKWHEQTLLRVRSLKNNPTGPPTSLF